MAEEVARDARILVRFIRSPRRHLRCRIRGRTLCVRPAFVPEDAGLSRPALGADAGRKRRKRHPGANLRSLLAYAIRRLSQVVLGKSRRGTHGALPGVAEFKDRRTSDHALDQGPARTGNRNKAGSERRVVTFAAPGAYGCMTRPALQSKGQLPVTLEAAAGTRKAEKNGTCSRLLTSER